MKRALCLLLILSFALLLGCADTGTSDRDPIRPAEGSGLAGSLYQELEEALTADPNLTAEELAAQLATCLPYNGISMAVESGYLTGFGNTEITGFSAGAQFGPVIGTQPMIGYVFELADGADRAEFISLLEDNANLRWNICTSANHAVAAAYGDFVLFVMYP